VWDLESQQCLQTIVGHRAEVWSIAVSPDGDRMISGTNDELLRMWNLDSSAQSPAQFMGSISRSSTSDRCTSLQFKKHGDTVLLGSQTSGKLVDVFRVRSVVEVKKKLKRRLKRFREKVAARGEAAGEFEEEDAEATAPGGIASESVIASDEIELVGTLRCSSKLTSFSFLAQVSKGDNTVKLLLSLQSNAIEVHEICLPGADSSVAVAPPQKLLGLELPGHRSDPRCLSFSSDSSLIASAASGSLKVWSSTTKKCVRSMDDLDGEATLKSQCNCLVWLPGDRYICIGTKEGGMILCDLGSGEVTRHEAHQGSISSMDVSFDNVLCTGSADHEVKFWDFEMIAQEEGGEGLAIEHSKTLKMGDDVTCVKFSKTRDPVKSLLAVATLDSTVRVYFKDSLKFYLQL
jgi:U3 small nucleolar RNA-associated protein 12